MFRVRKLNLLCVQKQTPKSPSGFRLPVEGEVAIPAIARDRMTYRGQVSSNLVGSSSLYLAFQKRGVLGLAKHAISGDRGLHFDAVKGLGGGGLLVL